MQNIRRIFLSDIKNICSHFFALVIAIGLCALPALYAWFNIYANWDPYANTGNIQIAVASLDKGYQPENGEYVNMGTEIEDQLREATTIGWVFLDTEGEALNGINSGKYYAAIVIEEDFSEAMNTALTDNFQNPHITYYENEKKNAVATKITDTAVDTLRKSINQQFIEVLTGRVFEATNTVSKDISKDSAFDRFVGSLEEINRNLKDYREMIDKFVAGNDMLTVSIAGATGSMDSTREKIEKENGYMSKAAQDMTNTNASLAMFNQNVQNTMIAIENSINNMSVDLDTSGIAGDAQAFDAQMSKLLQDADTTSTDITGLIKTLNKVAERKAAGDGQLTEEEKKQIEDKIAGNNVRIEKLDEDKAAQQAIIYDPSASAEDKEKAAAKIIEDDAAKLALEEANKGLQDYLDGKVPAPALNALDRILDTANAMLTAIDTLRHAAAKTQVDGAEKAVNQAAAATKQVLATCNQTVENIRSLYTNTLVPQMNNLMTSMQQVLDNVNELIGSLDKALGDMDSIFDGILDTVDSTNASLTETGKVIDDVSKRLTDATEKLKSASEDERVQELINLLGGDPEAYGSFFAEPVVVNTNEIYPVKNYGSAVTPFYTTLAIWVGGIFLTALFKVKADKKDLVNPKPWELFLGRYMIFFFLGQIQALIIVIGDIALLNVQCLHPMMFWFACSVTSFVFSLLIYSLTISFGDIGKALTVVMVVIQIAGSSGTFPIELLPSFYRTMYIFFPFPYAINAMRECIGGFYENTYSICLAELMIFAGAALFIGLVVRIPVMGINRFIEERMEDTKMM